MLSLPNRCQHLVYIPYTPEVFLARWISAARLGVMRLILALACFTSPAAAWEFAPLPICTLSHQGAKMAVTVTYDASLPEYAIHLDRAAGWPDVAIFALRFEGPRGMSISTGQHVVQGTRLTVRDRGFGNVLNGIAFNFRAIAVLGDLEVPVDLSGAAGPMQDFRACPLDQLSGTLPLEVQPG